MGTLEFKDVLQPDFLTVEDVAKKTGKTTAEVHELIERGELDFRYRNNDNEPVAYANHILGKLATYSASCE